MVSLTDAQFDNRFLDIMKQKTKLIDVSRMCIYIDILGQKQEGKPSAPQPMVSQSAVEAEKDCDD